MKHEKTLSERMYGEPLYTELVRIIRYEGCLYRELWPKLQPLVDQYGRHQVETAANRLLTYDRQFTPNPPPLAQVTLRGEVRKLAWGLLGPPPEHPWYAAWKSGERIPLPWEKPEPKAEEKPEEPKTEKPKRTKKAKAK